jgi:hypothetical protein
MEIVHPNGFGHKSGQQASAIQIGQHQQEPGPRSWLLSNSFSHSNLPFQPRVLLLDDALVQLLKEWRRLAQGLTRW